MSVRERGEKISKLGKGGTLADLAKIDKKLRLPRETSWGMGGFADYMDEIVTQL